MANLGPWTVTASERPDLYTYGEWSLYGTRVSLTTPIQIGAPA